MKLKKYLKQNRIGYLELAHKLKYHPVYINAVISGYKKPGPSLAIKINQWSKDKVKLYELRPDLWKR